MAGALASEDAVQHGPHEKSVRVTLDIGETAQNPGSSKPGREIRGPAVVLYYYSYGAGGARINPDAEAWLYVARRWVERIEALDKTEPLVDTPRHEEWTFDISRAARHCAEALRELDALCSAGKMPAEWQHSPR